MARRSIGEPGWAGIPRHFFGTHSFDVPKRYSSKIESTVRYLGIEVDDALAIG
jgi:hypothetical protein